jgi:hypothetical protein
VRAHVPTDHPTSPEERREKRIKTTPFFVTLREKKTFRINNKLAWDTYWDLVWKRGRMKIKNPNDRTRKKYPKISIGYLIHQDPALRQRVMADFHKWKEQNVEGLQIAKNPNGLHKGVHIHLEAPKLNPEASGLHKGDRYYGVVTEMGTGEFEAQLYDVRNGKPLRKLTVPHKKFDDYEARFHPLGEGRRERTVQAAAVVARRWLLQLV